MSNAARSKAKADAQLQKLREDRGVEGKNLNSTSILTSLEAALAILSDQLYQKSTHFLLELIQNADDNHFLEAVTPSLSLTLYSKGQVPYFRTDCNETGFTLRDIDAITLVGQSTKKIVNDGQRGYIGEKGIGFKSVFKVADAVNVVSGYYEFMFQRGAPLGMIVPILATFPEEDRLAGNTQFLLQLKDRKIYENIQVDLNNIEPQLLIFLRNLRGLNVQTQSASAVYLIQKTLSESEFLGETMVLSSNRSIDSLAEKSKYIIERHQTNNMPKEAAREGNTTSQVVLAFPINSEGLPNISRQKAFAFLPIDDFGFTFLLHADFLLVASREGLQYDNDWNLALRSAVQDAFVKAVKRFITIPIQKSGKSLRYTWPKYLNHRRSTFDFWNGLFGNIIEALRGMRTLQSRDPAARLRKPHQLRYLPTRFRFRGEPLFDCPSLRKTQLMFAYDDVIDELQLFGVQTMNKDGLYEDFSTWIDAVGISGLRAMSIEWHRRVAWVFCGVESLRNKLAQLPIIPLRDGTWVKASSNELYLASQSGDDYVPNGIDVAIVDQEASQDPERRRFYEFLGVQSYTPGLVGRLILNLHALGHANIANRTLEDLINDAAFLFKYRSQDVNEEAPKLYFAVTNQGQSSRRIAQIYVLDDVTEPNLVLKYKDAAQNPFFILDSQYERTICQNDADLRKEFHAWLLRSQNVLKFPQLIRRSDFTPEWDFLLAVNVTDLLLAIPNNLREYYSEDYSKIDEIVPSLQVRCKDGSSRRLSKLAIPIDALVQSCPHLAFADLSNPERYTFLEDYGIIASVNTSAWNRELQALATLPVDTVDETMVFRCYEHLDRASDSEIDSIRSTFGRRALVFFTKPARKWVRDGECVWNAPSELTQVIKLQKSHKTNRRLFRDILKVSDSGIKHIVDEMFSLQSCNPSDITPRCEGLLKLLQKYSKDHSKAVKSQLKRARSAQVFPVTRANDTTNSGGQPHVALRSIADASWYVPDRVTLESTFRGKVDLLKFPVELVQSFQDLFSRLKYGGMLLSAVVQEKLEPRGTKVGDVPMEEDLTTRMLYISKIELDSTVAPLSLRVWQVDSIVTVRRLGRVTVEESNEAITFQEEHNATNIYFRSVIALSEKPEVRAKLGEYISQRYQIGLENVHLLYLLLESELRQLPGIMARSNRFVHEEISVGTSCAKQEETNMMDVDHMGSTEPEQTFRPYDASPQHRKSSGQQFVQPTENCSHQTPMRSSQSQHLLRDLVPTFESKSQDVTRHAREYRVSKSVVARGAEPARTRREKLRRSLELSQQISRPPASLLPAADDVQVLDCDVDRSAPELTTSSTTQQINTRAIGFLGEKFIHTIMERDIRDWSYQNWTSKLRVENGHPCFTQNEGDFADFTYTDHNGHMNAFLLRAGVDVGDMWSTSTTYHLEVKTTVNGCDEAFYISQNQVNMMRRYDQDPENVYILLRIFDVEGQDPGLKVFPCPWSLYLSGHLKFASAGGYHVFQCPQVLN